MKKIGITVNISEEAHNALFDLKHQLDQISPGVLMMTMEAFLAICLTDGAIQFQERYSNSLPEIPKIFSNNSNIKELYPWFCEMKNVQLTLEEFQIIMIQKAIHEFKITSMNSENGSTTDETFWGFYLQHRSEFLKSNDVPFYELTHPDGSSYMVNNPTDMYNL